MTKKKDNKYELSWKAVFDAYSIKDLLWDSKYPLIIASFLLYITPSEMELNRIETIRDVCNIMLMILPPLLSILIASFSIWISFFLSRIFGQLDKNEMGKEVLNGLNASFLISIILLLLGVLLSIIVNICIKFNISAFVLEGNTWNCIILYFLYFMSIESVWLLKDVAKNLHNVAKFALLWGKE